jgi:hypothetical protein
MLRRRALPEDVSLQCMRLEKALNRRRHVLRNLCLPQFAKIAVLGLARGPACRSPDTGRFFAV